MTFRRMVIALLFILLLILPSQAQDEVNTFIQLVTDTTTMQTGERYTIRLEVVDIQELWSGEMRISYDPELIYVVGTKAGSPASVEGLLSDGGGTIFNTVNATTGIIHVGVSMFSPAEPITGSGVLASFDIVPLLSGTTEMLFTEAELISIDFETDASGQRVGSNPTQIEFQPILLSLSIEGDPATPPSEATATPTPSATPNPDLMLGDQTAELEATLANITAAPMTPAPETEVEDGDSGANAVLNMVLVIAIAVVVVSGIALSVMFVMMRRKQ